MIWSFLSNFVSFCFCWSGGGTTTKNSTKNSFTLALELKKWLKRSIIFCQVSNLLILHTLISRLLFWEFHLNQAKNIFSPCPCSCRSKIWPRILTLGIASKKKGPITLYEKTGLIWTWSGQCLIPISKWKGSKLNYWPVYFSPKIQKIFFTATQFFIFLEFISVDYWQVEKKILVQTSRKKVVKSNKKNLFIIILYLIFFCCIASHLAMIGVYSGGGHC
jgi:hypothetical protein